MINDGLQALVEFNEQLTNEAQEATTQREGIFDDGERGALQIGGVQALASEASAGTALAMSQP